MTAAFGRRKPRSGKQTNGAEFIAPGDYPQLLPAAQAKVFLTVLHSEETQRLAASIIAAKRTEFLEAVHNYVAALEDAAKLFDANAVYESAHEIRGLADTVGLVATGRISNGLCLYLDALRDNRAAPDRSTVTLHVDAIGRAARAEDEAAALGNTVAEELTALVIRKLEEAHAGVSGR